MTPVRLASLIAWSLRQVGVAAAVLLGASFLLFAIVRLAPGTGPGDGGLLVARGSDAAVSTRSEESWLHQYRAWLVGVVRGDFGRSRALQRGQPVAALLRPAVGRSFALAAAALAMSTLAALGLAVLRISRPHSRWGMGTEAGAHLLSAVPVFLWAYVAVAGGNSLLAWGHREGIWPLPSWFPLPSVDAWLPWLGAAAVLALGDGLFVDLYQRFRSDLEDARSGDHLVGVRMLGLSVGLSVARGFLPGFSAHLARRVGFVLGSLVILESALGWPGLGHLVWRAAAERDLPVLLGAALVLAAAVRVTVLISEAVWYAADPRNRSLR